MRYNLGTFISYPNSCGKATENFQRNFVSFSFSKFSFVYHSVFNNGTQPRANIFFSPSSGLEFDEPSSEHRSIPILLTRWIERNSSTQKEYERSVRKIYLLCSRFHVAERDKKINKLVWSKIWNFYTQKLKNKFCDKKRLTIRFMKIGDNVWKKNNHWDLIFLLKSKNWKILVENFCFKYYQWKNWSCLENESSIFLSISS